MEALREQFTPTCEICGGQDLTEVAEGEIVSHMREIGGKRYRCNTCATTCWCATNILGALNKEAAESLERPATCHGCVHLEEMVCTLYHREFTGDPTPLTRFCYTWEL